MEQHIGKTFSNGKLVSSYLNFVSLIHPDDYNSHPPPVPRKTGIPVSSSMPGGAPGTPGFKGALIASLMASRGGGGAVVGGGVVASGDGMDDEAQAILDEHVSKWDKSGHHTPSRARSPPNGRSGKGKAFII